MNDREALLSAILDEPDDDTVRLVYADFLQENGDDARAEFIRVQVRLHAGGPHFIKCSKPANRRHQYCRDPACNWCVLHRRGWALWKKNHSAWSAVRGVTNYMNRDSLRRGFIESISPPCEWLLAHGPAILAQHPVTTITLPEFRVEIHPPAPLKYYGWRIWYYPAGSKEYMMSAGVMTDLVTRADMIERLMRGVRDLQSEFA